MKFKQIVIIIIVLLVMTGCSNKINETAAIHVSNKIIKYINGTYDKNGLNSNEKKIFDDFVDSMKEDNYILNLSEIYTFNLTATNEVDTSNNDFVFEEDGDYKIKYSNINWIPYEYGKYATININGEDRVLYKKYVPVINEETKDNEDYLYIYDFTNTKNDEIDVFYKSVNATGGALIKFKTEKNKLKEVIVRFDPEYNYQKEYNNSSKVKNIFSVFLIIIVSGILIFGIVYLLKKI